MKIPPDVDELMWAIAEQDDPNAVYQFEMRYPKYAEEMLRRLKAIDALKISGKVVDRTSVTPQVPAFRNIEVAKPSYVVPAVVAGLTTVAIAAVIVVSNSRVNRLESPVAVNLNPATVNRNVDRNQSSQNLNPTVSTQQIPNYNLSQNNYVVPPMNPTPSPSYSPPNYADSNSLGMSEPKKSLILEAAPLHAAIMLVAEAGKLQVTLAPGLPNPEVKLNFENMTAKEMLDELGATYAFTVLPDGERRYLILPIKDEPEDPNTSERTQ